MAPFYGWVSTVSRLKSHYEETGYFFPLSPWAVLVLIWSTSEGWKDVSNLEPPSSFEPGTPGLRIHWPKKSFSPDYYFSLFKILKSLKLASTKTVRNSAIVAVRSGFLKRWRLFKASKKLELKGCNHFFRKVQTPRVTASI